MSPGCCLEPVSIIGKGCSEPGYPRYPEPASITKKVVLSQAVLAVLSRYVSSKRCPEPGCLSFAEPVSITKKVVLSQVVPVVLGQ